MTSKSREVAKNVSKSSVGVMGMPDGQRKHVGDGWAWKTDSKSESVLAPLTKWLTDVSQTENRLCFMPETGPSV
jgi:hypothetical protein